MREALDGARKFDVDSRLGGRRVGLILFASEARLLCEPSSVGISRHVRDVECGGSTNMADAISLATEQLQRMSGSRTIVLATDGYPDDADATLREASRAKSAGISILTIGTNDADAAFLRSIASADELSLCTPASRMGNAITHAAHLLLK